MVPAACREASGGAEPEVYNRTQPAALDTSPQEGPSDRHHRPDRAPRGAVANGRKLPFTSSVIIDQADALDLDRPAAGDDPRGDQVRQARQHEVDRLLEQAREEAEQILARAQEQATYLIEERELTRQAEEMSQEIVRQAQIRGGRRPPRRRRLRRRGPVQARESKSCGPSRASGGAWTCSTTRRAVPAVADDTDGDSRATR